MWGLYHTGRVAAGEPAAAGECGCGLGRFEAADFAGWQRPQVGQVRLGRAKTRRLAGAWRSTGAGLARWDRPGLGRGRLGINWCPRRLGGRTRRAQVRSIAELGPHVSQSGDHRPPPRVLDAVQTPRQISMSFRTSARILARRPRLIGGSAGASPSHGRLIRQLRIVATTTGKTVWC